MGLYTRKKGAYQQLTREQIRRLRRTQEVNRLLSVSRQAATLLQGMSAWCDFIETQNIGRTFEMQGIVHYTVPGALPNPKRLREMSEQLRKSAEQIRGM